MRRLWQSIVQGFVSLSPARRRILLVAGSLIILCLLTVITSQHQKDRRGLPQALGTREFENNTANVPTDLGSLVDNKEVTRVPPATDSLSRSPYLSTGEADPRIAYSADLGVITKDFVRARSSLEEILDRHRGYAARLRMIGHPAGSSLSATLKVPASEYSSTLADLKSIGDVQQDDEAADEIVQQRGDLEARLQNAKNNERRLQQLLNGSNDKSIDVDYVRRQLIALHAEVVRMELERHNVDNRVVFSNIRFSLREVRETPGETLSSQLRRAAASGLTDLIATFSTFLLVCVSYGPSFLLWAAILFFPARYLWRRSRVAPVRETA
jgi:Domain of unknown function (DUF4349)